MSLNGILEGLNFKNIEMNIKMNMNHLFVNLASLFLLLMIMINIIRIIFTGSSQSNVY